MSGPPYGQRSPIGYSTGGSKKPEGLSSEREKPVYGSPIDWATRVPDDTGWWRSDLASRLKSNPKRFNPSHTWAGLALQAGGHFFLAGKDSWGGRLYNVANPEYWCNFSSKSSTFGLAVGGEFALHMIFFLNTKSLGNIEGRSHANERSVTVELPVSQVKKLTEGLKFVYDLAKSVALMYEVFDTAKNVAEKMNALGSTESQIVTFKIGGVGVKAGVTQGIQGKIDILRVQGPVFHTDNL